MSPEKLAEYERRQMMADPFWPDFKWAAGDEMARLLAQPDPMSDAQ